MTAFTKLKMHLDRHAYKKGGYKGDAPADSSRRGKTHFRVVGRKSLGCMAVRMHNTDIITAYEDGRLILDCRGWAHSSTTKENMQYALHLCGIRAYLGSRVVSSKNQLCYFNANDGAVVYYDGMVIDSTGKVIGTLRRFMARRRDRTQTKEFEEAVKASGFKDMFKLLHATCGPEDMVMHSLASSGEHLKDMLTSEVHANRWKPLVANFAWETETRWTPQGVKRTHIKRDASRTWSALMESAKKHMYEEVPTDIYRL